MSDREIPDKQGRPVFIHARPGGWKITPYERDTIYQAFLRQFPDRDWRSSRAWAWMELEAEAWPISAIRIRAFISEGVQAEDGSLDRSWMWWVGCSLPPGAKRGVAAER